MELAGKGVVKVGVCKHAVQQCNAACLHLRLGEVSAPLPLSTPPSPSARPICFPFLTACVLYYDACLGHVSAANHLLCTVWPV